MNQNLNTPSQYVHPPAMCVEGTSGIAEVGSDDNRQPTSDEVFQQQSGTWVVKLHDATQQLGRWAQQVIAFTHWYAATISRTCAIVMDSAAAVQFRLDRRWRLQSRRPT